MHNQPWSSMNAALTTLSSRADHSCLPNDLIAAAPECAVDCIQDFVQSHYADTDCSSTSDLSKLCTQSNNSGLTIGEGAIQCIVSRCSGSDLTSLGVLNICASIPGALPNTATVITATIQTSTMSVPADTSDLSLLPTSIGQSHASQQVTSVVMASGGPSIPTQTRPSPTPAPAMTFFATSSASTAARSSSASLPAADQAASSSGLDSSQVIGIALGASAVGLITLAFIFFCCRHRKNASKRRSKRRSIYAHQTPPPKHGGTSAGNGSLAPPSRNSNNLSIYDPQQRYYAGVPEEKRRSFWRSSIKPEEIGVAIAPKTNEQSSPTSISSNHSMVRLIPKVPKIPGQYLWPAPLNIASRQRQQESSRPMSGSTIFDEDIEAQIVPFSRSTSIRDSFSLAPPPKAMRAKPYAVPCRLKPVSEESSGCSPSRKCEPRIPLTPTYDNGNVSGNDVGPCPFSRWKRCGKSLQSPEMPGSYLSEDKKPEVVLSGRTVLQQKAAGVFSSQSNLKQYTNARTAPKPEPLRKDSETTAATDIDEDSTPGEIQNCLEPRQSHSEAPVRSISMAQRSPISNLRYPAIPRSAAVSPQAEQMPRPRDATARAIEAGRLVPPRLTRDALIRSEASFVVSDTTSSDGYLSDQSIDWPVPPVARASSNRTASANHGAFKTNMMRLRECPESANRGALRRPPGPSLDEVVRSPTKMQTTSQVPNASPGAIPRPGDLYFRVEM